MNLYRGEIKIFHQSSQVSTLSFITCFHNLTFIDLKSGYNYVPVIHQSMPLFSTKNCYHHCVPLDQEILLFSQQTC